MSFLRLTGVFVVIAGLVFSGFQGWRWFQDTTTARPAAWMAGYVDVTATPNYAFENPAATAGTHVVLSFVVASTADACVPSWGTYYSPDEADVALDLDRRVARRVQQGGDVIVSFGGLLNTELATGCTDATELRRGYESVIDRYSLNTIDLDIEGDNLADTAAGERRASAIAAIQTERATADNPLAVWLTLPVLPTGLTEAGTTAVAQMLAAGVDLAGVNVMTMDYGASRGGMSMVDAGVGALRGTHSQLKTLYGRQGVDLGTKELWNKVGMTPMIGQNDVPGEILTLDDAKALNTFALENGVGRVSMWSLNRDQTCGSNYPDVTRVSDSCSGVAQGAVSFADVLGGSFTGTPENSAAVVTTSGPTASAADLLDDPDTSPYRVWSEQVAYAKDTKVVWHREVYVAKYWTQGDLPDNPVLQSTETPWTLIGPVLPGETPVPVATLPAGSYPEWDGSSVFTEGDRVMFDSLTFEAKWWTTGDSPQAAAVDADVSPWRQLTPAEITALLTEPTAP
ncbi:chitinase [Cryobacterium adonitolivorans]|uniref:chitinase n=1 Tax=Cryobacterium adonitolivorans TaxID=1259189 RepID=UPI001F542C16|nr:glycosyl hydrolase family 18 [Cryobacterium adonitolivorans]